MTPTPAPVQAYSQAVALLQQGHFGQAEKIAVRAQKTWPNSFDLLHLLGVIRLQSGKPGSALGLFEQALRLQPDSPDATSNMAMTLSMLGRRDEALVLFDKACALNPADWQIRNSRGSLLLQLDRAEEALVNFEQALSMAPHLNFRLNRGAALAQLRRFVEAIAEFDPALALRPIYLKALTSRGVAFQALNRNREAIADYERVLASDKNNADARHNMALALLTLGNYRLGFQQYESRWLRTGMPSRRTFGRPLWLGEFPPAHKTILLHAEQGLGDSIQFARYAPLLARMGATVVLEAPRELTSLFARIKGITQVVVRGEPLPPFDMHCPLGSLPLALATELSTVPADVPYLEPAPDRIARWQERLAGMPSRRIAIAWAGNVNHPNDRNRSIGFERLAAPFSCDAGFVSIQRDLSDKDDAAMAGIPQLFHVGSGLDVFA